MNCVDLNRIWLRKQVYAEFNCVAFHKSYFSFNILNISFLMNETGLQCTLLYLTHDNSNCTTKKTAYLSIFAILCNKALNLQPNTERNKNSNIYTPHKSYKLRDYSMIQQYFVIISLVSLPARNANSGELDKCFYCKKCANSYQY